MWVVFIVFFQMLPRCTKCSNMLQLLKGTKPECVLNKMTKQFPWLLQSIPVHHGDCHLQAKRPTATALVMLTGEINSETFVLRLHFIVPLGKFQNNCFH